MKPAFAHKIWGNAKLRDDYGYDEPGNDIGECWGISAHPHNETSVADGIYAGMSLSGLWRDHRELFGDVQGDEFPLLTKIITAGDDLSVQVHPDDAYASIHENGSLGKSECWYVLEAEPGSRLAVGHNATSREELADMINSDRWDELIRYTDVAPGDFIQIPPGTVHAIGGGVTLLETQQSSDITYRIYDYARLCDGKLRPLQTEQSIEVISIPALDISESIQHDTEADELVCLESCEHYEIYRIRCHDALTVDFDRPFVLMSVVEGLGSTGDRTLKKGDHFIVPSGYGKIPLTGDIKIIASCLPKG